MIAFAHLSDLHFGPVLANQSAGLPLQRPHHLTKCLGLPAAFLAAADLMNTGGEGADLPVVVSGDLTVCGAGTELVVAQAFLRSRPAISREPGHLGLMGLGRAPEQLAVVPGNHDHWGGSRIKFPPFNGAALYKSHFRQTPWRKCFVAADGAMTLELFGVDSNSGWAPDLASASERHTAGLLAQGRISKAQLDALAKLLQQNQPVQGRRVRALVCHHSLHHRGVALQVGELHPSSRDQLLEHCANHGVSALLTGHTHEALWKPHRTVNAAGRSVLSYELRCPHSVGPGDARDGSDPSEVGFLTHRIVAAPGAAGLRWDTWRWYWGADGSGAGTRAGYRVKQREPDHSFDFLPA